MSSQLNIHLSIQIGSLREHLSSHLVKLVTLALTFLILGCQPAKNTEISDQVFIFLENEVTELDKALEKVDVDLEELRAAELDVDPTVLSMKATAIHRHRFMLLNERARIVQERKYVQLQARRRAMNLRKRNVATQERDESPTPEEEYAEFLKRYRSKVQL